MVGQETRQATSLREIRGLFTGNLRVLAVHQHTVKRKLPTSPITRAFLLATACFLAITPFFWWGTPSGHDFEFHMFSWMEVLGQWKQGIVYPRWAALAHWGYGEARFLSFPPRMFSGMEVLGQWKQGIVYPRWAALAHWGYGEARFLFYPPASWTLGAALGALLPWKMVPGAYCCIALTLAAASMYRLARAYLPAADASFAAVFYALNPYHLLIVYWRSAYAELLAAALLPLLLLCLLKLNRPDSGNNTFLPTLWLSLLLAAAWLTNAPAALMIHYSIAGLAMISAAVATAQQAPRDRRWNPRTSLPAFRILAPTALAMLLGAGLASFYLLPAICEQRWINLSEVLSPGVRPQDNFLFTTIADPDHNRFNLLVSTVALAEIGALALAIWFSNKKKNVGTAPHGCPIAHSATESIPDLNSDDPNSDPRPWMLLSAWGVEIGRAHV